MSKLECNIVQDLLPSFADGLVNEKTAAEIKEHFAGCQDCTRLYKEMINDEGIDFIEAEKEIDYLKKVKKKNRKIIISILFAIAAVIVFVFGIYAFYGVEDNGYYVSDLYVDDTLIHGKVNLLSSANKITKVSVTETDGVATIRVRSALFSFKDKTGSAEFEFDAEQDIEKVQTADGKVLWENGEEIPQKVNEIYDAKVKYIGDNSAVSRLLQMINICKELKCEDYNIQLFTDEKPYGLKIYNINSYDEMAVDTIESYEQKIKSCAILILACIENADFVQFDYVAPDGTEGTYKLTVAEANDYLGIVSEGESVKDWADSRQSLKTLISTVSQHLSVSSQLEYVPYIIENEEIIEKLNHNPIDEKYLNIQNNTPYFSVTLENENYIEWAETYKKQYKIICNAIIKYAQNNSEMDDADRNAFIEEIRNLENPDNESLACLFYGAAIEINGIGTGQKTYCTILLENARTKTLRLAELAYLFGVDFEWIS